MIEKAREAFPMYDDVADDELMRLIHAKYYSDIPLEEFMLNTTRPNHESLDDAAVSGADSLDLQEMDSAIKPTVKMSLEQYLKEQKRRELGNKVSVLWNGVAYVIDPQAVDPVEAMQAIMAGEDSAILGYPQKGGSDAVVTRQGEVITDIPTMKSHAMTKNLLWGASGNYDELIGKAQQVAEVIKRNLNKT